MPEKDRIQKLLQEVVAKAKVIGTNVDGYQPKVARQGENVLAFVFYPTDINILDKSPVLVALKQTKPAVEICTPYEGSDYSIQKMLWSMGADGHSFQEDLERKAH